MEMPVKDAHLIPLAQQGYKTSNKKSKKASAAGAGNAAEAGAVSAREACEVGL